MFVVHHHFLDIGPLLALPGVAKRVATQNLNRAIAQAGKRKGDSQNLGNKPGERGGQKRPCPMASASEMNPGMGGALPENPQKKKKKKKDKKDKKEREKKDDHIARLKVTMTQQALLSGVCVTEARIGIHQQRPGDV